jgi:probable F420-dependent oxidoreductase
VRPFRFAVGGDADSAAGWRELSTRAEGLGYTTLFVADHYHLPAGGLGYPVQQLAPIAAMATAAAWTTTLRVGTRVFCTDYHLPVPLAKEAATIDLLSEGRLVLGLGGGWHQDEYEAMGLTFADGPTRIQNLEEVVAVAKAHFSGQPIDFDGEIVHVHDYVGAPTPVQQPHPEIMIGGSKRRVMSLAAREADIVSLSNVVSPEVDTTAALATQIGYVRDAAGDRFDTLDFELMHPYVEVTDDVERALAQAAPRFGVDVELLRDHELVLIGSVEQIVDKLQRRRDELGVNYITVPHHFLDAFAPVVAKLAGS